MNAYEIGFSDALKALGVELSPAATITSRGKARAAGGRLARSGDFAKLSEAEIHGALGPNWTEMGKSYPKAIALTLVGNSIDPDDPEARSLALEGFRTELQRVKDAPKTGTGTVWNRQL